MILFARVKKILAPENTNWVALAFILLIVATRLIAIDRFPVFIDETVHISTAERIQATTPLVNLQLSRVLTVWWLYLFQAYAAAPIWIARVAILLIVMPGFAALLYLARRIAGIWAMFLMGFFALFSPYHFFFERLALADPMAGSFVLVAIAAAYRLKFRLRYRDAITCAMFLFLAILAKTNVIPYIGVPFAAVVSLRPLKPPMLRRILRWLFVSMVILVGSMLLFEIVAALGHTAWLRATLRYVQSRSGGSVPLLARMFSHIQDTITVMAAYFDPVVFGLLLVAVLIAVVRRHWYLLLIFIAPMIALWFGEPQETRFWIVPVALLGLIGAVEFGLFIPRIPRLAQGVMVAMILVWGATNWLPQAITTATHPVELALPEIDRSQYILSDATGFGFDQLPQFIPAQGHIPILGLLANCQGLRYTFLHIYDVRCHDVNPDGSDIPVLMEWVNDSRLEVRYAILEESSYLPQQLDGIVIGSIDRPGGKATLRIYDLSN